jgi:hypothetical protein
MRLVLVVTALAACGGPEHAEPATGTSTSANLETGSTFAADDVDHPSYSNAELEKALIAERGAEATGERRVGDLEAGSDDAALRVAVADLAVRRRFIAALERCQSEGRQCPPRLDDPPTFDPPLRFDLDDWRKLADELHGRACACRTLACIDSIGMTIDELEARPMKDIDGDEAASASVTAARECLFRLRGKR